MAVVSLGIKLGVELIFRVAHEAATQALDQEGCARNVLGNVGKGAAQAP